MKENSTPFTRLFLNWLKNEMSFFLIFLDIPLILRYNMVRTGTCSPSAVRPCPYRLWFSHFYEQQWRHMVFS